MPTSSFKFTLDDHQDPSSFARAVGKQHVNYTPNGDAKPLSTTRSKDPTPLSNLTTWSYSDIMQGAATLKPVGATYDVFNQTASNSLVDILGTAQDQKGKTLGLDKLLTTQEQAFAPYDVILRAKANGNAPNANLDGLVSGATGDPSTTSFSAPAPKGKYRTNAEMRSIWGGKCATASQLTQVAFKAIAPNNPNKHYSVRTETVSLWNLIDSIFVKYNYQIRESSGGFNCRAITNGTELSLHSFGIACDFNASTNPYQANLRTDMPAAMITEIESIKSISGGLNAVRWGGRYTGNKDAMHFEIMLTPQELSQGFKRY